MPGTASSGGYGNRRKSLKQHELDGTLRKDRHADLKNPIPTGGRPEMPEGLEPLAEKEWHRLIWAFEDMGMLHRVDAFSLENYAKLYAETEAVAVQQAEAAASVQILEQNLPGIEASDLVQVYGQIVILRKLISKCTDQLRQGRMAMRQYLVEFGLTPASRGRIKLPVESEPVDEFTAFQQARVG